MKILLILHLLVIMTACEVATRVAIDDPKVPPTFRLSGNGYLYHFIVVGPYSSSQELSSHDAKVKVVWQLSPEEYAHTKVDGLPRITYGQVPRGFRQDEPSEGSPPALEVGKFYSIGSPSINANFRSFCFKVEATAVVEVNCE